MSEVTKQKASKLQWNLLMGPLANALEAMVKVREYGNEKYARIAEESGVPFDPESWRCNDSATYLESAQRHMMACARGERINHEDGGCEHMAQAMIDLGFALEIERQGGPKTAAKVAPHCWVTEAKTKARAAVPGVAAPPRPPPTRAYVWGVRGERYSLEPQHVDDLPDLLTMVRILSRKRRWGDMFDDALTVTRHSILVAKAAGQIAPSNTTATAFATLARAALLHDAHEALYGDMASPLKSVLRAVKDDAYDALCKRFDALLSERYDLKLDDVLARVLHRADWLVGVREALWLGIPMLELEAYFGAPVVEGALELALSEPQAWPPEDDTAAWLVAWRVAGGELPGLP